MRFRISQVFPCLLFPAVVFAAGLNGSATSLYVDKSGHDYPQCGTRKSNSCLTIQYTINQRAQAGDVLLIQGGVYSELVTVNKSLTLRGPLWAKAIVDGSQSGTVVTIQGGVVARLEYLTIRNGAGTGTFPSTIVGGIENWGNLGMLSVAVTNNRGTSTTEGNFLPVVGGVLNEGTLDMRLSSVQWNVGTGGCESAGGVLNFGGSVTVENSLIADNSVAPGTGCSGSVVPSASGYFNLQGSSTIRATTVTRNSVSTVGNMVIDSSTVSQSEADGVFNAGSLAVVNSTFSGNTGSGIVNELGKVIGTLDMSNSTVAGNGGDGVDFGPPLYTTIRNSILAGNGGSDCSGSFISGDYNLIQNSTNCSSVGGGHDIVGVSPMLKALGNYGGATQTMDLKAGSLAIRGGNPSGCNGANGSTLTTDQRGFVRPAPNHTRCDIGAVEAQRDGTW